MAEACSPPTIALMRTWRRARSVAAVPTDFRCRRPTAGLALFAAAVALLGCGVARVWPWIADDAFVSLRYAARLCAGDGLTWNDGERVEGFSNPLWVLLAAALHGLGLDLVTAARGLGAAASLGTLVLLLRTPLLAAPRGGGRGAVPILAASAPFAVWTIGGLETPLALWLTTLGVLRTGEALRAEDPAEAAAKARGAGLAFAWLAWTRPDGPLWAACATAAVALAHGPRWRRTTALAGPVLSALAVLLVCRLGYYGDWLPNPARGKLDVNARTVELGLEHLRGALRILRALLVPAALGAFAALASRRTRPLGLCVVGGGAATALYVTLVGGDLFPLARLFVPSLGALTLLAGLGLQAVARRGGARSAAGLAVAAVAVALYDARAEAIGPFAERTRWEWRGRAVGTWLAQATDGVRPLLAVDPAGAVPFYSGLPCVDMLGLCDRHIANAPSPDPAAALPGHARGDGRYVLDRAPDLVLFGPPTGDVAPRWPGGWQMVADPRFLADYRCVRCSTGPVPVLGDGSPQDVEEVTLRLWLRVDGQLGLRADGDDRVVPGWLCAASPATDAFAPAPVDHPPGAPRALSPAMAAWSDGPATQVVVDAALGPCAELSGPAPILVRGLRLPAGTYEPRAEPPVPGLALALRDAAGPPCPAQSGGFVVAAGHAVDLVGTFPSPPPGPPRLAAIRLARIDAH